MYVCIKPADFSQLDRLLFISGSLGLTSVHHCVVYSGQMSRKRGRLLLLLIRPNFSDLTWATLKGPLCSRNSGRQQTPFSQTPQDQYARLHCEKFFDGPRALHSFCLTNELKDRTFFIMHKVSRLLRNPSKFLLFCS